MKKTWKATFVIVLEGNKDGKEKMTSQMARDKLLTPLQEMWILRHINRFSIEEVEPIKVKTSLSHEDEEGERQSFYKTGFPGKRRRRK
jgi:hypothetical protein